MHPELFRIGNFPIRTFGVMVALGLVFAWWLSYRRARKFGVDPEGLATLGSWMVILGIIGARGVYVAQYWDDYRSNLLHIFSIREGGMTSFGGFLFGLIGLGIWSRLSRTPLWPLLDLIAAPALMAIAVGRIGCFFNGCCYGGPTDLPWRVYFPEAGFYAHPAQLYAALMHFVAGGILLFYEKRITAAPQAKWKPGTFISLAFVFYGMVRFIYESFRIRASSQPLGNLPLTEAHLVAGFMFLMGVVGLVVFRRRAPVEFCRSTGAQEAPSVPRARR
jgi:phosphatidylglycerol:prolipoprotein diacylglycerol transferase